MVRFLFLFVFLMIGGERNDALLLGPTSTQLEYDCPEYTDPERYGTDGLPTFRPLIIAHRGASGMFPEHTALAYRAAAEQGADVIECDLVVTKDYQFICSHEPWLSQTTDVSSLPQFRDRQRTYNMDDDDELINWNDKGDVKDWFSFDFTLEELKTLKRIQSNDFRDPRFDLQETIVTLEELVNITREYGKVQNRVVGIYPELKHPAAVNKIWRERGVVQRYEDFALEELRRLGFSASSDPCFFQSFELTSLEYIRNKTDLKLVFLLEREINETDWARLDKLTLAGLGFDKGVLVTQGMLDASSRGYFRTNVTDFIQQIHEHGMKAHGFTFRNEWMKLYWDHGQDPYSQLEEFLNLGIDGYFTDFPLTLRRFLHYKDLLCTNGSTTRYFPALLLLLTSLLTISDFHLIGL